MANKKQEPKKQKVGRFTLSRWDAGRVYVEEDGGEGGAFPKKDVDEILRGEEPAKALRKYYRENF